MEEVELTPGAKRPDFSLLVVGDLRIGDQLKLLFVRSTLLSELGNASRILSSAEV